MTSTGAAPAVARDEAASSAPPAQAWRAPWSGRSRVAVVSAALSVGVVAAFLFSLTQGSFPVPLADVVAYLVGRGSEDAGFIVGTLRLPRALTAILVGAAFGLSGAVFQSLTRNPLASPDIIGITAGASAAAVLAIVVGGIGASSGVAGVAFAGGLVTAAVVYVLAYRDGLSPYRFVLVGIGVAAALTSVVSFLLTRAEIYDAQQAIVWLTGSLNGRGWEHVVPVGIALAVLLPVLLVLARPLRALQLGDDTARGLGVRIEVQRAALVVVAVALATVATASAGPVAFVAFVSAPIARRLVRSPLTLVPAALFGALLMLVADLVARLAFDPVELPVGIVTGLVGAPYLVWLLARSNRVGRYA